MSDACRQQLPGFSRRLIGFVLSALVTTLLTGGCTRGPILLEPQSRTSIDRKLVERPRGYDLKIAARNLTAASSIAFVNEPGEYEGAMLVAESGNGDTHPRIYGWKHDGTFFNVYPRGTRFPLGFFRDEAIQAPIGGMVVTRGRIYITHRDKNGRGVVSSLGFDGSIKTVVGDLPAQGDHSVTDIAVQPSTGRLWFGLGSATNSGVVGLDNWHWARAHPDFCDQPAVRLKVDGDKFFTKNPLAGLFGGDDIAVTGPFQPFGKSTQLNIAKASNDKPTSAIYSISPTGGDLRVEAHGIRMPRGLGWSSAFNLLFATNNGMELRGTRPVKEDPDTFIRVLNQTHYGWPDYSTDLWPISDARFQPPLEMIIKTGYPELSSLVDRSASALPDPTTFRDSAIFAAFQWQSGAAKFDFVPEIAGFREYRGQALVALSGDRMPFSTSGQKLKTVVGRKVLRVDLDAKRVEEFIYNTQGLPASRMPNQPDVLERPVDVKFGPDGKLYILDYGRMEVRNGREKVTTGSGKIYVLEPLDQPAAAPQP